jgi:glycosyltransferase involved in cell wall biosynthesis
MKSLKHVILVSTYNQEHLIDETLKSLINQTVLPFKIIINDDFSSDNTFEIIKNYKKLFPSIFEINRNTSNKGLFENLNILRKYNNEGDVFSYCAGDDLLDLKCIENINNAFLHNNIDVQKIPSIVITNSKIKNGPEKYYPWNNYSERYLDPLKKVIRGSLNFRSVGFSRALFLKIKSELDYKKKYPDLGLGYDFLVCLDEIILSKRIIYINNTGAIYRVNCGITKKKDSVFWRGLYNSVLVVKNKYKNILDNSDQKYLNFILAAYRFKEVPSFKNWIICLKTYIKNLNNFYPNNSIFKNIPKLLPNSIVVLIKYFLK